jgi:hypothetical protein
LLALIFKLIRPGQCNENPRTVIQWYTIMLLPLGLAIFASMSFLTPGKAASLVLGMFVGRRWLQTGLCFLSGLSPDKFRKRVDLRGQLGSMQHTQKAL